MVRFHHPVLLFGVHFGTFANRFVIYAAMFGLLAYPALGIYKSIVASLSKTEKKVLEARLAHDEYFARIDPTSDQEIASVLSAFGIKK